jgi:rubrerythrin
MTRGLRRSINASKRDETGAGPRYERLAKQAKKVGDKKAANTFHELAEDERRHLRLLRKL